MVATPRAKTTQATEPAPKREKAKPMSFAEKRLALQKKMLDAASTVAFDKAIREIGYDYADTQQYKVVFGKICSALGLLYHIEIRDYLPINVVETKKGDPLYVATVFGSVTIADADDPSQRVTYEGIGCSGTVWPGYAFAVAQTNMLRNILTNGFMVDTRGRDADDVALGVATSSGANTDYVSPDAKAAMREELLKASADESQYATTLMMTTLWEKIQVARKVKPDFAQSVIETYFNQDGTPKLRPSGRAEMLRVDAAKGLDAAEAIIAGKEQ